MLNQCNFIGNIVRTPEIGTTEKGNKYTRFSIACNERGYKKQDGTEVPEHVEFVNITAWRGLADIVGKYTSKGMKVFVTGKFRTREYTVDDGSKRWATEIVADDVVICEKKRDSVPAPVEPEKVQSQSPSAPALFPPTAEEKDDLPF